MVKNKYVLLGFCAYLLLVLVAPVLKLAQVGPFAHWNWGLATVLLWGPWVLVGAAAGIVTLGTLFMLARTPPAQPGDDYPHIK